MAEAGGEEVAAVVVLVVSVVEVSAAVVPAVVGSKQTTYCHIFDFRFPHLSATFAPDSQIKPSLS